MGGELNLAKLQDRMAPELHPDTFVYCSLADFTLPPGITPTCTFAEAEGLTVIVERSQAQRFGLLFEFEARLITLTIHSSLEAVGFLAKLAAKLAQANISCNVVSAYHHDHLFVPREEATAAMALLASLASEQRCDPRASSAGP